MKTSNCDGMSRTASRLVTALFAFIASSSAALAAPVDGRVVAGSAAITSSGKSTRINQSTQRAIINWREFGIAADEQVQFIQPNTTSATLNRVTGDQVSRLMGQLDANGQVLLINPNGVIIGANARINVGSFVATTANMDDQNFMAGRLVFDEPGKPGAGIANEGLISAAEGGLVALVAPYVRNDGLIQARLGRVALGAGDTFTIDLYGDGLINLAVDDETALRMIEISNAGTIEVGGGEAVLMTAGTAGSVVDSLINLSGTVLASSVSADGGRIVLAGEGADITVSGTLDASGATGGGTIHVGGEWQGGGDTPTAITTTITAEASFDASATESGNGGEVVIWADENTSFAGTIWSRGGALSGNGGNIEVSGKVNLDFSGLADASAVNGLAGMLLLDPAILTVGLEDAGLISYVLATGTSVDLQASDTININSIIDGRGKVVGGGLTLTAGNTININDFIVTNNGALNFTASAGTINIATGKGLFAGTAPITLEAGGNISTGPMITTGPLNIRSTGGSVSVETGISQANRDVIISALTDILVNAPIISMLNGSSLKLTADNGDVTVNAQIDARPTSGVSIGAVTIIANQNVTLNSDVLTDAGSLMVKATNGALNRLTNPASLLDPLDPLYSANPTYGLFSNTGDISVTTDDPLNTGVFATAGALYMETTNTLSGSLTVDLGIHESTGDVTLVAAKDLFVSSPINNIRNGSDLSLTTTTGNITVDAQIDAQDDGGLSPVSGGTVFLSAGNDVFLNQSITTFEGAIDIEAGRNYQLADFASTDVGKVGTLHIASLLSEDLQEGYTRHLMVLDANGDTGSAPISIRSFGDLSTGDAITLGLPLPACCGAFSDPDDYYADQLKKYVALSTTGNLTLISDAGDVTVDAPLPQTVGSVTLSAGVPELLDFTPESEDETYAGNRDVFLDSGWFFDVSAGDSWSVYQADSTVNDAVSNNIVGGIFINNQLRTENQDINLFAGLGGVTVNAVDMNGFFTDTVADSPLLNSGSADLNIASVGDIAYVDGQGFASTSTVAMRSFDGSISGTLDGGEPFPRPSNLYMDALGNVDVYAGVAGNIEALSREGFIDIGVLSPGRLRLTTLTRAADAEPQLAAGDIRSGGFMGGNVIIDAARDITLGGVDTGFMVLKADRDILLNNIYVNALAARAGRDLIDIVGSASGMPTLWVRNATTAANPVDIDSITDPVSLDATKLYAVDGSVQFLGEAAVLASNAADFDIQAGDSVVLNQVQTTGGIDVTAFEGSITLNYSLGATLDPGAGISLDPTDQGLEYLSLQALGASGSIDMVGARSFGLIDIDTSGLLTTQEQIISTSTEINPLTIFAGGGTAGDVVNAGPFTFAGSVYGVTPLAVQAQLELPGVVSPAIPPGPPVAAPTPPDPLTALGADSPFPTSVDTLPPPAAGISADPNTEDEPIAEPVPPTSGDVVVMPGPEDSSTGDGSSGTADGSGGTDGTGSGDGILIGASDNFEITPILVFGGGAGDASSLDLGQGGSYAVSTPPAGGAADGDSCDAGEDCE